MKIKMGYGDVSVMTYGYSESIDENIHDGIAFCLETEIHEIGESDNSVVGKYVEEVLPDLQIEFVKSASVQVVIDKLTMVRDSLIKRNK